MTFCSAYGDCGFDGIPSCFGSVGVSPYAEDEPAKTRRLTWASRAAMSMFSVPSTFARCDRTGSFTDRGTDGIAARWMTYLQPATARAATAGSERSPSTRSPVRADGTFSRSPLEKSSAMRTD